MNKRLVFFCISAGLLASFYVFSKQVRHGFLKNTDFAITVKIQDKIPSKLDSIMDDGAILADGIVSSVLVLAITAWGFIGTKKKRFFLGAIVIPLAFFFLGIGEIYGKNILPHPGPPFFMVKKPTTIFPKFHVVQPYAYPSGHAGRSAFLAVVLTAMVIRRFWQKREKAALFVLVIFGYALFVWVSRIYLGHHWFSDIMGGILLGGAFSSLAVGFL